MRMYRALRRRNNFLVPSGLLFNEAPGHEFETEPGRVQVTDSFPAYASRLPPSNPASESTRFPNTSKKLNRNRTVRDGDLLQFMVWRWQHI